MKTQEQREILEQMLKKEKYRILIGAGGTGGHVFPAIALAKKFQDDGHRVIIVGTGN